MSNSEEVSYTPTEPTTAGAWRRFLARIFDIEFTSTLLLILLLIIGAFFPLVENIIARLSSIQMIFIALLFRAVSFPVDTVVHKIFGNTLGKQLLGIRVVNKDNTPLSLGTYLKRNFAVYIKGLWFYIPLLCLIPMLKEAQRILHNLPSSYDENLECQVIASPLKWWKVLIFSIFVLIYIVIIFMGVE